MQLKTQATAAIAGALVAVAALALAPNPLYAQTATPGRGPGVLTPAQTPSPTGVGVPTHQQMDQMMESVHGKDGARQMHELMGGGDAQRGEQLMDQCVGMMGTMQNMSGMMGGAGAAGMMGGQGGQSVQDAMRGMMGQ